MLVQSETEVRAGLQPGWLDWQTVEYRKIALNPSPESVTFSKDTTVTFLLDPSQPFPAGTTFSWVLRTEDGRDSIATNVPTHTRELEAGTDGKMLIIAHEKDSKRPIARDSVKIEPVEAEPYWRLTTIADSDNLIDLGIPGQSGELYDVLVRVLAAPGAGIIAIDGTLPNASVSLRVLPGATWTVDVLFGDPTPRRAQAAPRRHAPCGFGRWPALRRVGAEPLVADYDRPEFGDAHRAVHHGNHLVRHRGRRDPGRSARRHPDHRHPQREDHDGNNRDHGMVGR